MSRCVCIAVRDKISGAFYARICDFHKIAAKNYDAHCVLVEAAREAADCMEESWPHRPATKALRAALVAVDKVEKS